jgi:endonuclease YncB( thermonuclease family)
MLRLAAILVLLPAAALADLTGKPAIIDGDTIEIAGQRIRLHGIDAPESRQLCSLGGKLWQCGKDATDVLAKLISRRPVTCQERDQDRYGRIVAICYAGGEDLNAQMVLQGLALAYRRYSRDYVDEEADAQAARRGIWAGKFVLPWEWRRGKRLAAETFPQPMDCPIKGNINSKGERIYHVPGGRWYDRTKINPAKGERWFCTEEEALAAGWRAPRR